MTSAPLRKLRALAHGVALVTTAWLLVATSAPEEAARDCFEGLPPEATLRVTLGDALLGQGAAGAAGAASLEPIGEGRYPSCANLDGLEPGQQLVMHVTQGERRVSTNPGCHGYELESIEPLRNVVVTDEWNQNGRQDVFSGAHGDFHAGETCRGHWSLTVGPVQEVARGTRVSPLEAGDTDEWYLSRVLRLQEPAYCGLEPGAGQSAVHCEDAFRIERIEEVGP